MPKLNHRIIRLAASVICSCVAIAFILFYTRIFEVNYFNSLYKCYGFVISFPELVLLFVNYGRWGYAVPLIGLVIGIWLLFKRKRFLVAFELLIFGIWLFTILFVGYWYFGWRIVQGDLAAKELSIIPAAKPPVHLNGD
jgi:hypothetical protein